MHLSHHQWCSIAAIHRHSRHGRKRRRFFAAVARAPQRRGLRRGAGGGTLEGGDHHGEGATGLALGGWEVTPGEAPK